MSLRMQDYRCRVCGHTWEQIGRPGETREHCGLAAGRIIGAPAVHYKEGTYSPAVGHAVSSSREIDRELGKQGQWVPSPREAKEISQMTEAGVTPVAIGPGPDQEKIAKHAEKALERMHSEGLYSEGS